MVTMAAVALTSFLYFLIPCLREFETIPTVVLLLGLFAVSFLVFSFVVWFFNTINKSIRSSRYEKREQNRIYNENKEYLLDMLDRAPYFKRSAVEYFVDRNNKSVLCYMSYDMDEISQLFVHKEVLINDSRKKGIDLFTQKPISFKKDSIATECKLDDDVYYTLRRVKEETGKLSKL